MPFLKISKNLHCAVILVYEKNSRKLLGQLKFVSIKKKKMEDFNKSNDRFHGNPKGIARRSERIELRTQWKTVGKNAWTDSVENSGRQNQ